MTIKLPRFSGAVQEALQKKRDYLKDASMGVAFVAAISVLLIVAGYVITRMASDRAHKEKWKDYNDCGWA